MRFTILVAAALAGMGFVAPSFPRADSPVKPGSGTTPDSQPAPPKPAPPAPAPAKTASDNAQRPAADLKGFDPAHMDRSVDPCVDFYRYACGGWIKNSPIPPDRPAWGRDSELSERNLLLLRSILEKASTKAANRSSVDQKIGDYYASCVDEKAVGAAGAGPLKPELDRIASLASKPELAPEIAHLHDMHVRALFSFGSDQDFKDATSVIAEADQGGIGLPERDYYFRDDPKSVELRTQYVQHVANMFRLLGDTKEAADANAQKVMKMETALAKGSLEVVKRREPANVYHKMSLREFRATNPSFEWNSYLTDAKAPPVETLNVAVPEFFKSAEDLLKSEDLESWKTYLRWHLAHAAAPYLSLDFVNENFDFYQRKLLGTKELRPRWKRCVQYVDRDLGEALGQAYVEQAFSSDSKARTLKMVKDIEIAMEKDIESLVWMSPATKKKAQEKLHSVANKIGYPDKWRDYGSLAIARGDFFGNVKRSGAFETHRELAKIGKPVDRGEWFMTPPTVNAYYNPQLNDINFPAGILQPPYYDPKMDDAVNYGDAGGVIGHELTHGFDDEGRQFDARGNLNDWWTPEDGKAFDERAKCVEEEYSTFKAVEEVKVNGKLTLGENVADLGGLRLALAAFMDSLGGEVPQSREGLTPRQRFFLSYGQGWCENYTPQVLRLMAQTNPHAPTEWRVNGVVSNMPEFATTFGCKAGQPMVREKACRVW